MFYFSYLEKYKGIAKEIVVFYTEQNKLFGLNDSAKQNPFFQV